MPNVIDILGNEVKSLLEHKAKIPKSMLHLPGPDFVERIMTHTDRKPPVLRNLQGIFNHGRLAGTGYLSILPVDHGVEHGAGAAFAKSPEYFDPENLLKLAMEAGCSAIASTVGALGIVARKYAHKIPYILKINHNELLTYPNIHDQTIFSSVDQAFDMGAVAVGATVYFGSENSRRQIQEISEAFRYAHEMGLATILWAYVRNAAFTSDKTNYELAADLTGQANHLAATIGADIVKQKLPETNDGFKALNFGKTDKRVYSDLTSEHPIDLTRYQVVNCYAGRVGLINSGGASSKDDFKEAIRTAVINKRAGGMGVIAGRKAFQRPMAEGVKLLHSIQDVYLSSDITVA